MTRHAIARVDEIAFVVYCRMIELERIALDDRRFEIWLREAMASGAVRRDRLQSLIVTFKTRGMSGRHRFEEPRRWRKIFARHASDGSLPGRRACGELWQCGRRLMTDRTVVECRRIVGKVAQTSIHKMRDSDPIVAPWSGGYHILVDAVRKDSGELMRARTYREREQRSTSRTRVRVTSGTECRPVANKEILAMTARACDVSRKLRDVRKSAGRQPVRGRDLVTRGAIQFLMSRRRVRETIALLCRGSREEVHRDRSCQKDRDDYRGADPHFNAHPCPSHAGMSRTKTSHLSARLPASGTGSDRTAFLSAAISTSQAQT